MPSRLFHHGLLTSNEMVLLSKAQSHYLQKVMRCKSGDGVLVFNHVHGEWLATISDFVKNGCEVIIGVMTRPPMVMNQLYLAYAPVKQGCASVVTQATELGVTNIMPIVTERTIVRKVNQEKLVQNAIEATEQSERLQVPAIHQAVSLDEFLTSKSVEGSILFCKERASTVINGTLPLTGYGHCILVGPEGGFTPREVTMIEAHPKAMSIGLGDRIMKAPTAAIAAIAAYQALYGYWR